VWFQKISIHVPPPKMAIWFVSLLPPGISSFSLSKFGYYIKRPPNPLDFPITILGVGMDYFRTCTLFLNIL